MSPPVLFDDDFLSVVQVYALLCGSAVEWSSVEGVPVAVRVAVAIHIDCGDGRGVAVAASHGEVDGGRCHCHVGHAYHEVGSEGCHRGRAGEGEGVACGVERIDVALCRGGVVAHKLVVVAADGCHRLGLCVYLCIVGAEDDGLACEVPLVAPLVAPHGHQSGRRRRPLGTHPSLRPGHPVLLRPLRGGTAKVRHPDIHDRGLQAN